jgi:N-acetyl-anhydromuramyl-L-alanine amidase AmpD
MAKRTITSLPFTELEVATGNYDESRMPIDRVIIHTMVGSWQAAAARFDNPTQQVSAHYGVKLDGGLIHWLEESFTAYHAGNLAMNRRSIGIEHEDGGDYNGKRPDALYASSAKLVADICKFYNIPIDRQHILKHSEIIPTGCPDALDIDRIVREAQGDPMISITQKELDAIRNRRDELYNENVELKKAQLTLNQKIQELGETIAKDAREDHDLALKNLALEARIADVIKALGLSPDSSQQQALDVIVSLKKPHDDVVKNIVPVMDKLAEAAIFKRSKKAKTLVDKLKDFFNQFKGVRI